MGTQGRVQGPRPSGFLGPFLTAPIGCGDQRWEVTPPLPPWALRPSASPKEG